MTERTDCSAGDHVVPVIPYDTFEAANLYLATGRRLEEVLFLIGLTPEEWTRLHAVYRWFPTSLGEIYRHNYFPGLDDAGVLARVLPPRWRVSDDMTDLESTWHIREAVRRNPRIGPFKDCDWPITFIAAHPEAMLCCYTHDGQTVYYDGRPLADRSGTPLAVDAPSFQAVGGRWLLDKDHVFGQGEFGARHTAYWYVLDGVDRASFEVLNLRYARDAGQAYYITGKTIRSKSPDAFEIVQELRLNYRDNVCEPLHKGSVIARDREAVYFYGAKLKGARPAGFRVLGHGYATDGTNVWYLDAKTMIDGVDVASFTVPGPGEPYVQGRTGGGAAVTDRFRPYERGEACDPADGFEDWRPFFEARRDLTDWWWHKEKARTP